MPDADSDGTIYQHPLAYLIGLEGVALLRSFGGEYDREFVKARLAEVRDLLARADEFGDGVEIPTMPTAEGYTDWAPVYDAATNLMIAVEEPVIRSLLDDLPVGVALDAACGTARHGAYLASLGHRVIGVDSASAMLAEARRKLPNSEFHESDLDALPLPDDHVDLVVCSLALMHVPELEPVLREFVRVLRPGGRIVISDLRGIIGNIVPPVVRRGYKGRPAYMKEQARATSEYISTALSLGLVVERCEEPPGPTPLVGPDGVSPGDAPREHVPGEPPDRWALHRWAPEATNATYLDKPYVLICQFRLPAV